MQSKVDVLGGPTAMTAVSAVQAEHRLNLAKQIRKMATRIDRRFFSYERSLDGYVFGLLFSVIG